MHDGGELHSQLSLPRIQRPRPRLSLGRVGWGFSRKGVAGVAKGGYLAPSSTLASSHLGPGGEAGQCLLLL